MKSFLIALSVVLIITLTGCPQPTDNDDDDYDDWNFLNSTGYSVHVTIFADASHGEEAFDLTPQSRKTVNYPPSTNFSASADGPGVATQTEDNTTTFYMLTGKITVTNMSDAHNITEITIKRNVNMIPSTASDVYETGLTLAKGDSKEYTLAPGGYWVDVTSDNGTTYHSTEITLGHNMIKTITYQGAGIIIQ